MANEPAALLNSVLGRLGRNFLLFQQIEAGLKLTLPYMHAKGSARGDVAFARFREKTKGQTLGKLVQDLQESMTADNDNLALYLERMVEQRNQLVHHFFEIPGVSLSTAAGCRAAIHVLDEQHSEARALQDLVHALGVSLGAALTKATFKDDAELVAACTALKQQLPAHVEYIDLADPSETNWPTTRIVQALQEAEARTEPVNGMTSLALAGAFLRSLDVDLGPKAYGVSKLKRILILSGAFEIFAHFPQEGAEPITLYRSKPVDWDGPA
jgi:hypothetical protein